MSSTVRGRGVRAPGAPPATAAIQFRQGDVLLVAVDALPPGARRQPRRGRLVLAEGEATGHAHAIHERDARLHAAGDERYLVTASEARLVHEEHAAIDILPGIFRVVVQREYEPRADGQPWRTVAD